MASREKPDSDASSGLKDIQTLPEVIRYWAERTPDTPAFIFRAPNSDKRHVLTYSDLYRLAGRWASVLHDKGLGRGDFVVNALPNSPERAVVECSILLSGATSVNGMCQLRDASDLLSTLRQSRAAALVLDPDVMGATWSALRNHFSEQSDDAAVKSDTLPDLKFVFQLHRVRPLTNGMIRAFPEPGEKPTANVGSDETSSGEGVKDVAEAVDSDDFIRLLQRKSSIVIYHSNTTDKDDLCTVFTTSGTTGFCKLVPFTHKTLLDFSKAVSRAPNVAFNNSPMGWSGGYACNTVLSGSTRVLCDGRAGAPEDMADFIFRSLTEEGVANAAVPGPYLQALADRATASGRQGPLLAVVSVTSQPKTKRMVQTASKLARMIMVGYASTEALFIASTLVQDPTNYEDNLCGKVVTGVHLKVLDEAGQEVEAGKRGQIVVKSAFLFRGYLNDPDLTSAAFTDDGYFRTGDVGWLDTQGRLFVEGRGSDAIMRGGYIFYPGWMEARIRACLGVSDVMVVGVPDPVLNQELCACVVLESPDVSLEDVQAFVEREVTSGQGDPTSPRPRHYLAFDAFPYTSMDKPDRKEVQRIAQERLRVS
nr:hypothetical protein BaRGS_022103 [Batillaria attramentaria]